MSVAQIEAATVLASLCYAGWLMFWLSEALDRRWHGAIAVALVLGPVILLCLAVLIFGGDAA